MFICDRCDKVTRPYETCHTVIIETRDKIYETYKNKMINNELTQVPYLTKGTEIIKELKLCGECYERHTKN